MKLTVILLGALAASVPALAAPSDPAAPTDAATPDAAPTDDAAPAGPTDDTASDEAVDPVRDELDRSLERRIRDVYAQIEGLDGVTVSVQSQVLRLEGQVDDPEALAAARDVAARFDPIYIDDRLQTAARPAPASDVGLRDRLTDLYAAVPAFAEIQVEARSGVVRLTGEVPSSANKEAATDLAKRAAGVVFVDDQIRVTQAVDKRVAPAIAALRDRGQELLTGLPLLGIAIVVLAVFWFLSQGITRVLFFRQRAPKRPLLAGLARQSVRIGIFLLGLLLVLDLLDLTTVVGAMLGTAGILGVALGLAFRDIVENYLASIILTIRQPFSKDDLVLVAGHEGRVLRLTLRETVLVTDDGNHVRVPNATVFKSVIENFTTSPMRRFSFSLSVPVDDVRAALPRVREALTSVPGVLLEPAPVMSITAIGDSTFTLSVAAWVNQRDVNFRAVSSSAMKRVKAAVSAPQLDAFDSDLSAEPPEPAPMPDREDDSEVDLLQ